LTIALFIKATTSAYTSWKAMRSQWNQLVRQMNSLFY